MMNRPWLNSLTRQIFLLSALPLSLLVVFAVLAVSYVEVQKAQREWASFVAGRMLMLADQVRLAASPSQQAAALQAAANAGLSAELRDLQANAALDLRSTTPDDRASREESVSAVAGLFGRFWSDGPIQGSGDVAVRLGDARSIIFRPQIPENLPTLQEAFSENMRFAMFAAPILILLLYSSRRITRPLVRLAEMARRSSLSDDAPSLSAIDGTTEIHSLSESFDILRSRTRKALDQRANTLRTFGRDLQAPLARLRMSAQCCPDRELLDRMMLEFATLADMIEEGMVHPKNVSALTADA